MYVHGNKKGFTGTIHQMISLFPSLSYASNRWGIFKNVKSKSVQHILLNYPTPQEIVQLGFDAFNEDLKKASKGRLSSVKIKNCFDVAKTSVGIIAGQDSIVFEIQSILEAVLECDKLISKLESKMDLGQP